MTTSGTTGRRRLGLTRRLVDLAVNRLARLLIGVFFREVEVVGAEAIPRGRPLLLVANHVNSLVDPIVILGFLGVRPRFLAKSTLWSHPVVSPLLALVGALPVYRPEDIGEDVARNLQTFAGCRDHLAAGGTVALFPEGKSHNEAHGLPLKTGAARIALEAEAEHGPLGLRIVPVGITYEAKDRFRSRLLVRVGEPLDPCAGLEGVDGSRAVHLLTARIAAALEAVGVSFASWGEARLIDQALALVVAPDGSPASLSRLSALRRSALRRYRRLERVDPDQAARLASALVRCGPDPGKLTLGIGRPTARRRIARGLRGLVALTGSLLNAIPYRVAGWAGDRLTRTPDEPATYKILTALIAFPVFWALEVAAAGCCGWGWGTAMALIAPVSGYVALRHRDEEVAAREARERRRAASAEEGSMEVMHEREWLRRELLALDTGSGPVSAATKTNKPQRHEGHKERTDSLLRGASLPPYVQGIRLARATFVGRG